jgi:hypothetical protein
MPKFLVLYRGGDASTLSPAKHKTLMEKWGQYMQKLGASGALKDGAPLQSSAAVQIVGKAKTVKAKRAGKFGQLCGRLLCAGRKEHQGYPDAFEDVPPSHRDGCDD